MEQNRSKKKGLGIIALVCDVTHRRYETAKAMLDILFAEKELLICNQKEHILHIKYLAYFKARTDVLTR